MILPPTSKEQVLNPIQSPHGETVYEMIGRAADHGGVNGHSLAHVVIAPGQSSLLHFHQLSEETYYLLMGVARISIDSQEFELVSGQAVLILPGQKHQIFNPAFQDLEFLAICAPAWYPEDSFYVNF
jgi:ethanolamine utilization protein EutQ